jgi:RNA polymerase sigma factor (sigma-70 family)
MTRPSGIEPADQELVKKAWAGDREAFNMLVSRHRQKAYQWAKRITNDAHLAEDIVQDALLRSFLHLGDLMDSDRFLPWLKSIVRNQAINYLRKKEHSHLIQPFSSYTSERSDPNRVDYDNLNSILSYLTQKINHESQYYEDPAELLARKEWIEMIQGLLQHLSPRARKIFESHFFKELSPQEIAHLFQTKTSSVYNTISRSRLKIQDARLRMEIEEYIKDRNIQGKQQKKILPVPSYSTPYTSMAYSMFEVLQFADVNRWTLTEVMALSGHAFRINIAIDCGPSSPFIYDWGYIAKRAFQNLGYQAKSIGHPNLQNISPEMMVDAISLVHESVDRGIPAIAWNLTPAEFSLIYGYDDQKGIFIYRDVSTVSKSIAYDQLGRCSSQPDLFVAAPFGKYERLNHIYACFQMVLEHGYGKEPSIPGYLTGLAAYDVWIEAIRLSTIDPIGHAYNVAILADARKHAVDFLQGLSEQDDRIEADLRDLFRKAALRYMEVYQCFIRLYPSFPYSIYFHKQQMIDLLYETKRAEEEALKIIQELKESLQDEEKEGKKFIKRG